MYGLLGEYLVEIQLFENLKCEPQACIDLQKQYIYVCVCVCAGPAPAYRRTRQPPRGQHSQGGKKDRYFSLSFGHSFGIIALISTSYQPLVILNRN